MCKHFERVCTCVLRSHRCQVHLPKSKRKDKVTAACRVEAGGRASVTNVDEEAGLALKQSEIWKLVPSPLDPFHPFPFAN